MVTLVSRQMDFPEREPVRAGIHPCGCFAIVDIGTHLNQYGKMQRMLRFGFEILDEHDEEGKPRTIWTYDMPASLGGKSRLKKLLEGWLGILTKEDLKNGIDTNNLLGKPIVLNLVHRESQKTGKIYANIDSAGKPNHVYNPTRDLLSFDTDRIDVVMINKLPRFLREKIEVSQEYLDRLQKKSRTPTMADSQQARVDQAQDLDDEIPF